MPPGNQDSVIVRGMEAWDAEAVAALTAQLGYQRNAEQTRRWIEELGNTAEQAAFVACFDNQIAGWIEVSIERRLQSAPFAMIGGLVVRDGMRGAGIGRLLCKAAEDWACNRGIETMRVTSRSTRTDAHRFYLRDGYETVKMSMVFEKKLH